MSTEDELRGQPSRPVSRVQVCLCGLWQHNLCACVFDPGFEDSGWICVFVCRRRRKHLGGLFLQKWWNRTFFSTFLCVCMTPCATLSSKLLSLFTLEFPFFFSFSHLLIFTPLPLLSGLHFLSCVCLTLFFYTHHTVLIFFNLTVISSPDSFCLLLPRLICPIQAGPATALWPAAQRVCQCYYLITRRPHPPCLSTRAAYLRRVPPQHVPTTINAATITTTTTTAITAVQRSQILFQSSWILSLIQ